MAKKRTKPVDQSVASRYFLEEAEPFWMQDVRIAQRKIAADMQAIRRASNSERRPSGDL